MKINLLLFLFIIISSPIFADCTITGPTNSSSNPFAGCSGTITVQGDFTINSNYNITSLGDITIVFDSGMVNWSGNYELTINSNSKILLHNNALLDTSNPCNSNRRIKIGSTVIARCNGGGGALSFADVNTANGVTSAGVLPVDLVSFYSEIKNNQVLLNWQTSYEEENEFFEIEHSENGRDFSKIGQLNGQGNSNELTSYSFEHKPNGSTNYYRLRQVDYNGSFSYSSVVFVKFETTFSDKPVFHPNPSQNGLVSAHFFIEKSQNVHFQIFDLNGKKILSESIFCESGSVEMPLNWQNLEGGIYMVAVSFEGFDIVKKLVVL